MFQRKSKKSSPLYVRVSKTSYADLSFDINQIANVNLEGDGQNIETVVLKTGDKLSGVVSPDKIGIRLPGDQVIEIDKDKIKEIIIGQ